MNLVVADTSPINYLVLVDAIEVLPKIFSKVVIPAHVIQVELQSPKTTDRVRLWAAHTPSGVEIRTPISAATFGLDPGEAHVIALALELNAVVLIDEKKGRQVAKNKGIPVVGTLGIIERAAEMSLLDIRSTLTALRRTNAYINDSLINEALLRHVQKVAQINPLPPVGPD